jgi:hypothetical protein
MTLVDLNDIAGGGRNFTLNSSFITGDTSNWTAWGTPTSSVASVTDLVGYTKAYKVITTGANQGIYQTIKLMPSTTYTISFWCKADSGSGHMQLAISNSVPATRYVTTGNADTATWTKRVYTFTTASNDVSLNMQLGRGAGGSNGTYYFTGIKFEIGDTNTDWTPAPEDAQGQIDAVNQKLSDMANDLILTQTERGDVKDIILKITGTVIGDTATLPTAASLDAGLVGDFYSIRKQALNAGILSSDTTYTALATQWGTLKTYLDALSPKPWDTANTGNTTITSTWRTNWNSYYTAYNNLQQLISDKLNIDIGGRNYMPNSSADYDDDNDNIPDGWGAFQLLAAGSPVMDTGRLTAGSIKAVATAVGGGVYTPKGVVTGGVEMTMSGWMKADTACTLGWLLKFRDSADVETNPITQLSGVVTANTWTFFEQTFIVPATAILCSTTPRIIAATGISATTPVTFWVDDMKLEKGNQATDWSSAPEDVVGSIGILETRIADAEIKILPNNIISTVTNHTDFQFIMSSKADTGAGGLGDKADQKSLDEAIVDLTAEIAAQVAALPFDDYALTTYVDQKADSVTTKIEAGGGINLIKNSVGWADFTNWSGWASSVTKVIDVDYMGFGKGFEFMPHATLAKEINQSVEVIVGVPYTLSWHINKKNTTTDDGTDPGAFWVQIQEGGTTSQEVKYEDDINTNGWKKFNTTSNYSDKIVFTPASSIINVRFTGNKSADVQVTGIMLNIGVVPLQWTMATGEIYNTNIRMDLNGIRVESYDNGTPKSTTVMTPEKFAGYYDTNADGIVDTTTGSVDEVFVMDGEQFIMKNAVVKETISLGSIKMTYVSAGGFTGWAFSPND